MTDEALIKSQNTSLALEASMKIKEINITKIPKQYMKPRNDLAYEEAGLLN